jgi:hypothetical protein
VVHFVLAIWFASVAALASVLMRLRTRLRTVN